MRHRVALLSKVTVPPKSSVRITDHPDATTTLWVDSGTVHLENDKKKHPLAVGGPVSLGRGPVVVRNPSAKPATLFAAVTHGDEQLFCVFCPDEDGNKVVVGDLSETDARDAARTHNDDNANHHAVPQRQAS